MDRSVAVINVDSCVKGDLVVPNASPILKDVILAALHAVPSVMDPGLSYYESLSAWLARDPESQGSSVEDSVRILGSGSDHDTFAFYAGVPALFYQFKPDPQKYPGISGYPTYHTGFETFHLMDKIIDPGFLLHRSCAQLATHALLQVLG